MERVTDNVFVETRIRGCNPGYVVTDEGVIVIDTPQLPGPKVQEMNVIALYDYLTKN